MKETKSTPAAGIRELVTAVKAQMSGLGYSQYTIDRMDAVWNIPSNKLPSVNPAATAHSSLASIAAFGGLRPSIIIRINAAFLYLRRSSSVNSCSDPSFSL